MTTPTKEAQLLMDELTKQELAEEILKLKAAIKLIKALEGL